MASPASDLVGKKNEQSPPVWQCFCGSTSADYVRTGHKYWHVDLELLRIGERNIQVTC